MFVCQMISKDNKAVDVLIHSRVETTFFLQEKKKDKFIDFWLHIF